MCPAGFFSPELAEVVSHGVVGGFVEGFMGTFAEFIVALGDLPYCILLVQNLDELKWDI